MKKMILTTLAAMVIATSATALAAPVCGGDNPQEYATYPEALHACCCGGETRDERGNASKN